MNASGQLGVPFIVVSGLTKCELPEDSSSDGCLLAKVEGLGASTTNILDNTPGYLLFCHRGCDAKVRLKLHQQVVFNPMVNVL